MPLSGTLEKRRFKTTIYDQARWADQAGRGPICRNKNCREQLYATILRLSDNQITQDNVMPSNRIGRINEDVKREISFILREVKDPRVKDCFLSVIRVEVTNDLSYCTVMVSTMEGLERTKSAVKGLESAAGFIRRELGSRLKLRHTPQILFKATDAIEYGASINRILNDLDLPGEEKSQENNDGNEDEE